MGQTKTVVLGLGNRIYSDDAVGVFAVQLLEKSSIIPEGVTLIEGGTLGLALLPYVSGATRWLVLDAVDVAASPGTIVQLAGEELRALPRGASAHEAGLSDLAAALHLLGEDPPETVLLGVQPGCIALGATLSPPVEKALPQLVETALALLNAWAQGDLRQERIGKTARPDVPAAIPAFRAAQH
jgi:hydrogenase maturation protease